MLDVSCMSICGFVSKEKTFVILNLNSIRIFFKKVMMGIGTPCKHLFVGFTTVIN